MFFLSWYGIKRVFSNRFLANHPSLPGGRRRRGGKCCLICERRLRRGKELRTGGDYWDRRGFRMGGNNLIIVGEVNPLYRENRCGELVWLKG